MFELKRHIYANTVDRVVVKKLINKLFVRCQCKHLHECQQKRHSKSAEDFNDELYDLSDDFLHQVCEEQTNNEEIEQSQNGLIEGMINDEENKIEEMINDKKVEVDMENERMITSKSKEQVQDVNHVKNQEYNECTPEISTGRICGGHDVALPIESAVQELDMPEESIATLLCYLELHPNRWLEVLQPVKALCSVKFYGGHAHLLAVAKKIPPIAAAVVHCEKKGKKRFKKQNSLLFPVVEIADKMGWDLDPVYKELWALQWNSSLAPNPKMSSSGQSGILVEFSDNAVHVRTPGDLSDEERDDICDFISDRIQAEERTQLKQLNMLYTSLKNISCSEYWQCSDEVDKESDNDLKVLIKSYFDDKNNATQNELEAMKKERENPDASTPDNPRDEHVNWDGISRDLRTLTNIHHDQSFTGRAVARIFHGISSPCYPAEVWGRDRRFWRKYLDVDFNSLRRFSTRELLKLR